MYHVVKVSQPGSGASLHPLRTLVSPMVSVQLDWALHYNI
jgi:hypothetical protein